MASLLSRFRSDHDPERPKKEVPKVAFYVLGAAFTLSTGLTLLILPYVRQAAKQARLAPPPPTISARSLRPIPGSTGAPVVIEDTALREGWKSSDDFTLVRAPGAPGMGNLLWLGIRALGIATAIVGAGAGVGVVAIAKFMGVTDMEEFNAKMRETLARSMPELAEKSRPLREGGEKEPASLHDFLEDLIEEDAVASSGDNA